MSAKELEGRYEKVRNKDSASAMRMENYVKSKIAKLELRIAA